MTKEIDMGDMSSPEAPAPIVCYQQFHDLFVIRGSVQAFKCNYETGDVEFWLFGGGGGDGNHPLKTRVTPKQHLKEALQAFSEGRDWQAPEAPTPAPDTTYKPNDFVVARDISGFWYCGQILAAAAPNKPGFYEVGFTGFTSQHDHTQHVSSIRPQMPYPKAPKDFAAGTKVLYCDAYRTHRKCFEGTVNSFGYVIDAVSEKRFSGSYLVMALL